MASTLLQNSCIDLQQIVQVYLIKWPLCIDAKQDLSCVKTVYQTGPGGVAF